MGATIKLKGILRRIQEIPRSQGPCVSHLATVGGGLVCRDIGSSVAAGTLTHVQMTVFQAVERKWSHGKSGIVALGTNG